MSELKRCPFCGGEVEVRSRCNDYETDNFVMHFARCNNCKAETAWCREETEAIKAWNTRKSVDNLIERLEEEIDRSPLGKGVIQAHYLEVGLHRAIEIIRELM